MLISLDMFISGFKDTFLNIGNGLNVEDGIFQVIINVVFNISILVYLKINPFRLKGQKKFSVLSYYYRTILTYLGSCSRDICTYMLSVYASLLQNTALTFRLKSKGQICSVFMFYYYRTKH